MADIEFVIKISEKTYNALTYTEFDANLVVDEMRKSIVNGTPLPKGHGRLIDADDVIAEATKLMKYPLNREYMECVISHVKLAPTIIEADREESEDEE